MLPVLCKLRNVEVQFPIIEESPKLDVPTVRHVRQCCRGGSPVGHAMLEALFRTRRLPRGIVACLKFRWRVNNCTYLGHRLSARFHMATSSRITTQDETGANLAHTLARAHTHTHTRSLVDKCYHSPMSFRRVCLSGADWRSGCRYGMRERCKFLRGTYSQHNNAVEAVHDRLHPSPCPLGHCT